MWKHKDFMLFANGWLIITLLLQVQSKECSGLYQGVEASLNRKERPHGLGKLSLCAFPSHTFTII